MSTGGEHGKGTLTYANADASATRHNFLKVSEKGVHAPPRGGICLLDFPRTPSLPLPATETGGEGGEGARRAGWYLEMG